MDITNDANYRKFNPPKQYIGGETNGGFMSFNPEIIKKQLDELPNKYKTLAEQLKQSMANEKESLKNDLKAAEIIQKQEAEEAKKQIAHRAVTDRTILNRIADSADVGYLSQELRVQFRHGINQKMLELSQLIIDNQVTKKSE